MGQSADRHPRDLDRRQWKLGPAVTSKVQPVGQRDCSPDASNLRPSRSGTLRTEAATASLHARSQSGRGHGSDFARFTLAGHGMHAYLVDRDIAALGLRSVRRLPRIPYGEALSVLTKADVALGIFGTSEKAGRVVPHKVYQSLALGVPTVTRRSAAIAEFFRDHV